MTLLNLLVIKLKNKLFNLSFLHVAMQMGLYLHYHFHDNVWRISL